MFEFIKDKHTEKIYVFGGPGTGKTHSIVQRVKYFKEYEKLSLLSNVLILSFTRAAVQELQKRFSQFLELKSMIMNIYTFDEFSARLNISLNPTNTYYKIKSYEENILNAIRNLIEMLKNDDIQSSITGTVLENIEHVIIDEIQDLNLSRAELVQYIFKVLDKKNLPWGFTILGDMKQEIFSYTQNEEKSSRKSKFPRSKDFINWIYEEYEKQGLKTQFFPLKIESNPRFKDLNSDSKESILKLKDLLSNYKKMELNEITLKTSRIIKQSNIITIENNDQLREFIYKIKELIKNNLKQKKTAVILFRRNDLAYFFSLALFSLGVKHKILLENLDKQIPPWVAQFIRKKLTIDSIEGNYLERKKVFSLWDEEGKNKFKEKFQISVEYAWKVLSILIYGEENQEIIELDMLYNKFSKRLNESILYESGLDSAKIIISTIHKSKGREYDYVIMCEFGIKQKEEKLSDILEEIRVKYVALTRSKCDFFLLDYGFDYIPTARGREKRIKYNPKNLIKNLYQNQSPLWWIKIKLVDIYSFIDKNLNLARKKQSYIWDKINVGDNMMLEIECNESIIGHLFHSDMEVGAITNKNAEKIIAITRKRFKISPSQKVFRFSGLKVIALISEILPPYVEEDLIKRKLSYHYQNLRLWFGIRVAGPLYYINQ